MTTWKKSLFVLMAAGAVLTFGNASLTQADTTTPAVTSAVSLPITNDKTLTLKGDAIAVQKLKLGKTMTDGTTLVKIYYLKAGDKVSLEGPYSDLGGYEVNSSSLPKINTDRYAYILNDEGLSQSLNTLVHKNPASKISKDEPKFNRYSKVWAKQLNSKQVAAINEYSKNYGDMNNWLRGLDKKASKTTKAEIKQIDQAFKKFKNPKQTTVWRGLSTDGFMAGLKADKLKVGAVYQDKGYMSTTFDQEIALKYGTGIVLEITLPKGKSTGAYIGNLSDWKIEKEYLIKHGSQFKVTGISDLGDNKLVSLTYVK